MKKSAEGADSERCLELGFYSTTGQKLNVRQIDLMIKKEV